MASATYIKKLRKIQIHTRVWCLCAMSDIPPPAPVPGTDESPADLAAAAAAAAALPQENERPRMFTARSVRMTDIVVYFAVGEDRSFGSALAINHHGGGGRPLEDSFKTLSIEDALKARATDLEFKIVTGVKMDVCDILVAVVGRRDEFEPRVNTSNAMLQYVRMPNGQEPLDPSLVYVPILAIERKRLGDLASSMVSTNESGVNRLIDQVLRSRAFAAQTGCRIGFLFENYKPSPDQKVGPVPFKSIDRKMNSLALIENITPFKSFDVHHSVDTLRQIVEIIIKYQLVNVGGSTVPTASLIADHTQAVHVRKADNFTPSLLTQFTVQHVPGCGELVGRAVARRYPLLANLVDALRAEGPLGLARIETDGALTSLGNSRTVGPSCSRAIYHMVLGIAPPTEPAKRTSPSSRARKSSDTNAAADDDEDTVLPAQRRRAPAKAKTSETRAPAPYIGDLDF